MGVFGTLGTFITTYAGGFFGGSPANQVKQLDEAAFVRTIQDQGPRLSLAKLKPEDFTAAIQQYILGNPAYFARIVELVFLDPEIKAAEKQLVSAICSVPFTLKAPNDTPRAQQICDALDNALDTPDIDVRGLTRGLVKGAVRGLGLIEQIWNAPTETPRTWTGFQAIPMQRIRLNRETGVPQFTATPWAFQGIDCNLYPRGKWIVMQPDLDVLNFSLRGIVPALLSDWFGRLNVMSWWEQALQNDAQRTIIGKGGSVTDRDAIKKALQDRGAKGGFLLTHEKSEIKALEGMTARGGTPYAEYMTKTAQRIFLALLGESQTGIIEKGAGSVASAGTHYEVAQYQITDFCTDIAFLARRDMFQPFVEINFGLQDAIENTPFWIPNLKEAVDLVKLNQGLSTRPKNARVGLGWWYEQSQIPEPADDDELLDEPAAPVAPPQFGVAAVADDAAKKMSPASTEPESPAEDKSEPGEEKAQA